MAMDMSDGASLVRVLENVEKLIDAGNPEAAKEIVYKLRQMILKAMSNA